MNVAYILRNNMASTFQLATMILPQLEKGNHGATVLGMFFFDDNLFVLQKGDPVGERLASVASSQGILLMMCDQCAVRRNMAEETLVLFKNIMSYPSKWIYDEWREQQTEPCVINYYNTYVQNCKP